ncbi:MAG: methylglutaconyl-CoA hydratase [Ignavibacteriales bacterium CG_4_9_14_3_um_filter_30_11]|nr:MAG: methylglutaconyl-CoA hydratase [Ignavibacteriales bacterium CG_4_9_14_3_um_filter_30_11]
MILYEKHTKYSIIKLNNPGKRNALSLELIRQLKEKLVEIKNDDSIKTLIITGVGKSFCAGVDLKYLNDLRNNSAMENQLDTKNLAALFLMLYNFPKPTIAAVNGAAIAGGSGLASVCDFIVADNTYAKFGYSEVKIGFIPAIVSIFLINRIGEGRARQLLISGDIIDAKEAKDIGFANYLSDDSLKFSVELAEKLCENSSLSMNDTKQMINDISNMNVEDAVEYCVQLNTLSRSTEDFRNGIEKFLNKK